MNKTISIICVLFSLLNLPSFIAQESKNFDLTKFDKLIIQGRYEAEINYGDSLKLEAVAHDSEIDFNNLSLTYSDESLTIKYKGSLLEDVALNLIITLPELSYVEARAGCEIRVNKKFDFKRKPVHLYADSGGKISLKGIDAPWVKAEITKGGSIKVTGKTALFDASVRTGGTIGAANLKAKKVTAEVAFGGEIICNPEEKLDAKVTSGGTIDYMGSPKVSQNIRLGGNINNI
tara:strand:- start:5588 stop:6286 length:699 start_codon:yes stop_codon:yes gene_type:complete